MEKNIKYTDPKQIIEEKKQKDMEMVKIAHSKMFHRELWVDKRIPFAKEWLMKNDKEWFEENKDAINMNQALGNRKGRTQG